LGEWWGCGKLVEHPSVGELVVLYDGVAVISNLTDTREASPQGIHGYRSKNARACILVEYLIGCVDGLYIVVRPYVAIGIRRRAVAR
jgi:hypothetical protein